MIDKVMKNNALVLVYEMLSDEGKSVNKNQKFNFIPNDSTPEELHGVGTSIGTIISSSIKELRQDISFIIMEV